METKKIISYLPERTYLNNQMKVREILRYFQDFYDNFDVQKARRLLKDLDLDENQSLSKMSKGMKEKVQLVLVLSREAELYILDEPLGGVDPATRDYILDTILSNFNENASVIIYLVAQSLVLGLVFAYGLFDPTVMDLFKTGTVYIDVNAFKTLAILASVLYVAIIFAMSIICKKIFSKGDNIE